MMKAYVVADRHSDVEILRRLVDEELCRDVEFLDGPGIEGMTSIARTLASHYQRPLAIVLDAHSSEPEILQERRQSMEEVVGIVAGKGLLRVILAVPQLDIIFFEAPALLERLYPGRLSPMIMEIASLSTRRALKLLDPGGSVASFRQRALNELTEQDVVALRETSVVRDLSDFLRKVQNREVPVGRATVVS